MKNLLLVTVFAIAASVLLREARQIGEERAEAVPAPPPARPSWKVGEFPGRVVVLDDGSTTEVPAPPRPPAPGKKAEKSRSKRPSPTQVATQGPSEIASSKTPPAWFPRTDEAEQAAAKVDDSGSRVLLGRLSASEDRARQDLRKLVEVEVSRWIAADVPTSWKVPARVVSSMVQGSYDQVVTRSLNPDSTKVGTAEDSDLTSLDGLYTLHRAAQKLDFSPSRRSQIVGMYRRDLASQRMQRLGGGVAVALVGLAVLSGYLRADEATKGYYTKRLRLAAAASLGVAGVVAYRYLA